MKLTAKQFRQNNRSKILSELGTIWATFNMDLQSNIDTVRVSPRLRINTSGVTNQGRMVAARSFDQRIFTICGTRIFKNTDPTLITAFTEEVGTSGIFTNCDPLYSDMENFGLTLCVSSATKLVSKASNGSGTGAWTDRRTFDGALVHKLKFFQKHNRLYWLDTDLKILSCDTAFSVATSGDYTCVTPADLGSLHTMEADIDNIWIGTIQYTPNNTIQLMKTGYILRWDGITANTVFKYPIKAQGVLALCPDDSGVMHAMDTNGALLRFNSGGFTEIDRLPINKELLKNAQVIGYSSFIHPNGMVLTKNGTFKILVNNLVGDSGATVIENFPSGIWEWSKEKGFVHSSSATLNTLANSTLTDFGQNKVSAVGALYEPNIYSESASGKPTLIAGIDYYSDATTAVSGIFVDDPLNTLQKYGYFITGWLFSSQLKDTWQRVWVKVKQLLDSGDKIIVKTRIREIAPTEASITWIDTTHFITTTSLSSYSVGDEVEILQGTGGGKCAHITELTQGDTAWFVTLDETFTGVTTGTAKARFQKWKKAMVIDNQTDESGISTLDIPDSERIQIKCCLQFKGDDELFEIGIINDTEEKLL